MTIFNTNPPQGGGCSGSGFGSDVGDIYAKSKDEPLVKELELTNQEQILNGTIAPELQAKSGYYAAGGITSTTLNNTSTSSIVVDQSKIINKEAGISYILNEDGSNVTLFKTVINAKNMQAAISLGAVAPVTATSISMCFKDNDLYLFFASATTAYCRVLDTTNDTWKTSLTVISSSLGGSFSGSIVACHNNKNTGKVNLFLRSGTFITYVVSTTDGVVFSNELQSNNFDISGSTIGHSEILTRDGSKNYYNGKYYFYKAKEGQNTTPAQPTNGVFSIDEVTYDFQNVAYLTTAKTTDDSRYFLNCTESGIFFFPVARTGVDTLDVCYSDDGFATHTITEVQNVSFIEPVTFLTDESSAYFVNFYTTKTIFETLNLSTISLTNKGNIPQSATGYPAVCIDEGQGIWFGSTNGTSNDALQTVYLDATFSDSKIKLPAEPYTDPRISWRVRSET